MPNHASFINWGFQSLLLALGAWGVTELSSMSQSIQELNIKMAVVLERDESRGREMESIKLRLERLEEKRR